MTPPPERTPDATLALALVVRQAALFLASLIEAWCSAYYGKRFRKPTVQDREGASD